MTVSCESPHSSPHKLQATLMLVTLPGTEHGMLTFQNWVIWVIILPGEFQSSAWRICGRRPQIIHVEIFLNVKS